MITTTWFLWQAASADPTSKLVDYGAIGIFSVLLIYMVKKLDERSTKNFEARLADKDAQLLIKDEMIERLQAALTSQIVPAMTKNAQVLEQIPAKEGVLFSQMQTLHAEMQGLVSQMKDQQPPRGESG